MGLLLQHSLLPHVLLRTDRNSSASSAKSLTLEIGDMIEVFKIVAQIYDNKTTDNVLSFRENMNISLRGHGFTL